MEVTQDEYRLILANTARKNKYNAIRTTIEISPGRFRVADSRAEANRWIELRLLEQAGEIHDLIFHPVFLLIDARDGWPAVTYEADYQYWEAGRLIVEDVKGGKATQTALFMLKARLLVDLRPDITFRIEER